jgi:small redox-active disulfide protein 2
MKSVKVLGPGCQRCETMSRMVSDAAASLGVEVLVEKVSGYAEIAGFGVVSTPGLVVDGKVVHAGGLPKPEDVARWIGG